MSGVIKALGSLPKPSQSRPAMPKQRSGHGIALQQQFSRQGPVRVSSSTSAVPPRIDTPTTQAFHGTIQASPNQRPELMIATGIDPDSMGGQPSLSTVSSTQCHGRQPPTLQAATSVDLFDLPDFSQLAMEPAISSPPTGTNPALPFLASPASEDPEVVVLEELDSIEPGLAEPSPELSAPQPRRFSGIGLKPSRSHGAGQSRQLSTTRELAARALKSAKKAIDPWWSQSEETLTTDLKLLEQKKEQVLKLHESVLISGKLSVTPLKLGSAGMEFFKGRIELAAVRHGQTDGQLTVGVGVGVDVSPSNPIPGLRLIGQVSDARTGEGFQIALKLDGGLPIKLERLGPSAAYQQEVAYAEQILDALLALQPEAIEQMYQANQDQPGGDGWDPVALQQVLNEDYEHLAKQTAVTSALHHRNASGTRFSEPLEPSALRNGSRTDD